MRCMHTWKCDACYVLVYKCSRPAVYYRVHGDDIQVTIRGIHSTIAWWFCLCSNFWITAMLPLASKTCNPYSLKWNLWLLWWLIRTILISIADIFLRFLLKSLKFFSRSTSVHFILRSYFIQTVVSFSKKRRRNLSS